MSLFVRLTVMSKDIVENLRARDIGEIDPATEAILRHRGEDALNQAAARQAQRRAPVSVKIVVA
jgi:hypothetical protein